jgi:ferredoxin
MMSVTLRVDPIVCRAHGLCAELLPERIELDEWGYPIVDAAPLGTDLVRLARRAAKECPVRAVLLTRHG